MLVKEIHATLDFSYFGPHYSTTSSGNQLYFIADNGEHGFELWRSDGTSDGTRMVKDINPGKSGAFNIPSTPWTQPQLFDFDGVL